MYFNELHESPFSCITLPNNVRSFKTELKRLRKSSASNFKLLMLQCSTTDSLSLRRHILMGLLTFIGCHAVYC